MPFTLLPITSEVFCVTGAGFEPDFCKTKGMELQHFRTSKVTSFFICFNMSKCCEILLFRGFNIRLPVNLDVLRFFKQNSQKLVRPINQA